MVGGEIDLNGGIIKTAGGNIELVSVKQGNVNIDFNTTGDRLDTSGVREFGDLKLSNKALLDTSGVLSDINLQGKNISLEDASAAVIQNLGKEQFGNITVRATNSTNLSGTVRNSPDITTPEGNTTGVVSSQFTTETLGMGKSGNILIESNNLSLGDGSSIYARSYSSANTGNLNLEITDFIQIEGFSTLDPNIVSLVGTIILNNGSSGDIDVAAKNINIFGGGGAGFA